MKRQLLLTIAATAISGSAAAQTQPKLHVNPRWTECSFQIDASLTQDAWRVFTKEAGLVTYFRPLSDARPMGRGNFEVSMLQWQTNIDDTKPAWNDTFVHPDSTHWLIEGSGLAFPGATIRAGISDKMDLGVYATKAPGANYGFYGAQLQRVLVGGASSPWNVAARVSFVSLYGPDDVDFTVHGVDVLASRTVRMNNWITVSPYAGLSHYLARSHEKSAVVALRDENVYSSLGSLGAAVNVKAVRLGAEYNVAAIKSFSMKVGVGF